MSGVLCVTNDQTYTWYDLNAIMSSNGQNQSDLYTLVVESSSCTEEFEMKKCFTSLLIAVETLRSWISIWGMMKMVDLLPNVIKLKGVSSKTIEEKSENLNKVYWTLATDNEEKWIPEPTVVPLKM